MRKKFTDKKLRIKILITLHIEKNDQIIETTYWCFLTIESGCSKNGIKKYENLR